MQANLTTNKRTAREIRVAPNKNGIKPKRNTVTEVNVRIKKVSFMFLTYSFKILSFTTTGMI